MSKMSYEHEQERDKTIKFLKSFILNGDNMNSDLELSLSEISEKDLNDIQEYLRLTFEITAEELAERTNKPITYGFGYDPTIEE